MYSGSIWDDSGYTVVPVVVPVVVVAVAVVIDGVVVVEMVSLRWVYISWVFTPILLLVFECDGTVTAAAIVEVEVEVEVEDNGNGEIDGSDRFCDVNISIPATLGSVVCMLVVLVLLGVIPLVIIWSALLILNFSLDWASLRLRSNRDFRLSRSNPPPSILLLLPTRPFWVLLLLLLLLACCWDSFDVYWCWLFESLFILCPVNVEFRLGSIDNDFTVNDKCK